MSRCFPFPPPGYEKKPSPDDDDVLKKENLKERKHKKEKKDKEKREGKEKREKERSNGKHGEKKDKKEKHKDKKKDKEKDREKGKEKSSTSEERSASGQLESYNGEKIHQRESERGKENGRTSEDRRQSGQFEGCNGEKVHQRVEQSKYKISSDEKKPYVQFQRHSGAKPAQNSLLYKDSEDSKFVQELGRRIRDEGKGTGSQLVEGFMGMDWKKDEGIEKFAVRDTSMVVEVKEKKKDKRVDSWKMDGQRMEHEAKFSGNAVAQNLAGSFQNKVGVSKPLEKVEGRMEGKERFKEREVDDKQGYDKRGDKQKSKEKEKQNQGKDNNGEKEKKKEDKAKEKKESKKSEKDKTKSSNKSDLIGVLNNKTSHLSKNGDRNAPMEDNLKKRKDMEKNRFLHDSEVRLEKMPRLTSHLSPENGKKLETARTTTPFTPDRQGTTNNLKVDNKDRKINGLIGAQQLPISTSKPSPVIAEQIAEASRKPPHPDTKYLSKVLSVPKMDEWSGFDDQEWLFSSENSLLKKSEVGSVGVNQAQRVWDEALQLGSADVCALPYVIPY